MTTFEQTMRETIEGLRPGASLITVAGCIVTNIRYGGWCQRGWPAGHRDTVPSWEVTKMGPTECAALLVVGSPVALYCTAEHRGAGGEVYNDEALIVCTLV